MLIQSGVWVFFFYQDVSSFGAKLYSFSYLLTSERKRLLKLDDAVACGVAVGERWQTAAAGE
jgi:hypothetical protein